MRVAIDISPITTGHYLQHRVRGTGFYLTNLKGALLKEYGESEFTFTKRGDKISEKIDVIHYPYFEPFFLTLPIKKPAKTIITVHDLTPIVFKNDFPSGIKGNFKWQIQKNILRKTDLVITDSESSKKDILRIVGLNESKVKVVYLAAADHFRQVTEEKKLMIKKKFNLPSEFILYVGDVTSNKNLPRLIEAVNKTDYSMVIVGQAFKNLNYDKNNAWNKDLKRAQELASKNKKIITLGFVQDEDLVGLYNCATALVLPSLYEGFGLPILEAMQSGCPVLSAKSGSIPEIAGNAVLYVDPFRVDSIKEGIEKLMTDKKLRENLIKSGLENCKKFTWKKTAKETYEAYRSLFSKN